MNNILIFIIIIIIIFILYKSTLTLSESFHNYKVYDKNPGEGILYIGKIPENLTENLKSIKDEFYKSIPEEKKKDITYHIWYKNLPDNIKSNFNIVRNSNIWKDIFCKQNESTCVIEPITEIDEIYYSKPPNDINNSNVYGAAGNYKLHLDFISYPGIIVNRVLIGMTPNEYTSTEFPKKDISHKLNTNEFVAFDFGREWHQVKKDINSPKSEYRIMAKLHFIVCKKCKYKSLYFKLIKQIHIQYMNISRYILKTGTNPKNIYEFSVGFILESVYKLTNIYYLLIMILLTHLIIKNKTTKRFFMMYLVLFISIILVKYINFKMKNK